MIKGYWKTPVQTSPSPRPPRQSASSESVGTLLLMALYRLLAPVLLLIVLPLAVMWFLEKHLSIVLDPTDRSLIHFFLFLVFLAYVAILSPTVPRDILHSLRHEFEARISAWLKPKNKTPPTP